MTRWQLLVASAAVLAALGGCGHKVADRGGTPSVSVAEAALQGGSADVALQVANGVLASQPNNAEALCVQGDALTMLGRVDEATASYAAALRADAGSIRAHLGLGRLRLASDPAAAETTFLDVLHHDPRNAIALSDLGIAQDLQGRHAQAQQSYREALGINPEMTAAQVNLALSLAMSGDHDGAARLMRPIATAPDASRKLRHDYAVVLAMAGNRAEAERILAPDLSPAEIRQFLDTVASRGPAAVPAPVGAPVSLAAEAAVLVQLAAADSEDAAQTEWQHLQERLPALLTGHQPLVTRSDQAGHVFWRLRTAGFADAGAARAFCDQLRAAHAGCVVITR
jgi:Flp pilus assembly protein TadD